MLLFSRSTVDMGYVVEQKKMHGVNEVELQLEETHSLSELHTLCTGLT